MPNKKIKAYKAFNKGLICRDFQYEVGKEYTHEGKVDLCNSGFHACEEPLNTFNFYSPATSEFAEVEQSGEIKTEGYKTCSSKIKIIAKLELAGFIKAAVDVMFKKINFKELIKKAKKGGNLSEKDEARNASTGERAHNASTGDWARNASTGYGARNASTGYEAHNASTGDWARNASTGYEAHNASTGDWAHNASTGNEAHNASTGNWTHNASTGYGAHNASTGYEAHNASTGDWAHNASTGERAHNASTGDWAHNASTGERAHNASTGYGARNASTGKNSVIMSCNHLGAVKGIKGTLFALVHHKKEGQFWIAKKIITGEIGKKGLKEDVWYGLDSKGKIVEVDIENNNEPKEKK